MAVKHQGSTWEELPCDKQAQLESQFARGLWKFKQAGEKEMAHQERNRFVQIRR